MEVYVRDLDVLFISYDEPEAERNFDHLCGCSPRDPKRIHGVAGFHAAYSLAARRAETEYFVTVDGDSRVYPDILFQQRLELRVGEPTVFAFRARNLVNGLIYGNGSVKVWPVSMLGWEGTHEASSRPEASSDFHVVYPYRKLASVASDNCFASTPLHAFRGGYREVIKLCAIGGRLPPEWPAVLQLASSTALKRLKVWLSVGADATFGLYAILGARAAMVDLWVNGLAVYDFISDYDWLSRRFGEVDANARTACESCGTLLRKIGIVAPLFSAAESKWIKETAMPDGN